MVSYSKKEKHLIFAFLALSLLYIVLIPFIKSVPLLYILKDVPDVILAILALGAISGIRGKLLFASYMLCAVAGLALDLPIDNSFLLGLVIFLLGHTGYIITFSRDFMWQPVRLWLVVAALIYAGGLALLFAPYVGSFLIPVYCYIAVITLMFIFAALRGSSNHFVIYGALLFLISDSALAINMFITPLPGQDYIVMITYFAAQFFILFGFLEDKYHKST